MYVRYVNKGFSQKGNMKRHYNTQHTQEEYKSKMNEMLSSFMHNKNR